MEKEFVPYAESLELKEIGFDEPCLGLFAITEVTLVCPETGDIKTYRGPNVDKSLLLMPGIPNQTECETYFGGVLSPLYQQAFRWFREKRGLVMEIRNWNGANNTWYYTIHDEKGYILPWNYTEDTTHEEAELACLKKLIELVKNK